MSRHKPAANIAKNITNPYPSEEQKATFSNVRSTRDAKKYCIHHANLLLQLTGISMTQVSNWFINHRRRCPELREKRERVRTGSMLDN